jgi:hypothetical protein
VSGHSQYVRGDDVCDAVLKEWDDPGAPDQVVEHLLQAARGYQPTDTTFCWQRQAGLRLKAEFFCPATDARPAGTLFRPKGADAPEAKPNMGPRLSAMALDAGSKLIQW